MDVRSLTRALRREARGISRLCVVLVIAGLTALFPSLTSAQNPADTAFFSPPPGTGFVQVQLSKEAQLMNGIEVRALVVAKCGGFLYPPSVTTSFTVLEVDQNIVRSAIGFVSPTVVCDNVVHRYQGDATQTVGSTPLATGAAVIQATINACGTNTSYQYQCVQSFASRPVTLK